MNEAELQSGSDADFEVHEPAGRADAVAERSSGKALLTRLSAIGALIAAVGCGNGDTPKKEHPESIDRAAQIQLQLNNGRNAGVSVFHAQDKEYDFRLTSSDDPSDTIALSSTGERVELLEGTFSRPTSGYLVEAFDKSGTRITIDLTKAPGTIYGPDKF